MDIRKARKTDIPQIVDVNTKTWRTTYSGLINESTLMSQESFRAERITSMENQLADMIINDFKVQMAVVEIDGDIIGFATYGALRTDDDLQLKHTAEVYAIYILRSSQGQGFGKALFDYIIEDLKGHKVFNDLLIWTLKDNPSRPFYEKVGGQVAYERRIEISGQTLDEVGYLFKNIFRG